jgi:hypothetical protein
MVSEGSVLGAGPLVLWQNIMAAGAYSKKRFFTSWWTGDGESLRWSLHGKVKVHVGFPT